MRVLLDECLPRGLKGELPGHDVRTVPEVGWAGLKNGELLERAEGQFDVFLTVDRGIQFQQSIPTLGLAVIALSAKSNRLDALKPLMPEVLRVLPGVRNGQFVRVGG